MSFYTAMINEKWLDLLRYAQQHTSVFSSLDRITDLLNQRAVFMKAQFSSETHPSEEYLDWIEHEVFVTIINDELNQLLIDNDQAQFLFDLFLSTNLCQLCLSLLNHHQNLFENGERDIKQGIALQKMGEWQQAELAFNCACISNPESGVPLYHIGYCQLYTGNPEQALISFERSVQKSPDFAPSWQSLAGCYYQDSRFEDALDACAKVRQLDPSIAACYITATSSLLALERSNEALKWLKAAEQQGLCSSELDRLGGICALQNDQPELAISKLTLYLNANPDDLSVIAIRAQAMSSACQWTLLQPELLRLLEADPHNNWCIEQLFLTYFHTMQWAKAETAMIKLKALSDFYLNRYENEFLLVTQKQSIVLANVSQ